MSDDEYAFDRDGSDMSLWEKLRESYNGRWHDARVAAMSDKLGTSFFWFITVTELYVVVAHALPHQFGDLDDNVQYYMKVLSWFIFLQTIANWTCVRFCDSAYRPSEQEGASNCRNGAAHFPTISLYSNSTTNGSDSRHAAETNGTVKRLSDGPVSIEIDCGAHDSKSTTQTNSGTHGRSSPLAWKWCGKCHHSRPPRSHHCVICGHCILKRDHHCYMTGVCIGFRNQRHFVVLNFYIAIASCLGLVLIGSYLRDNFAPKASTSDYFLPLTIYRAVFGDWITAHHVLMLINVYSLWWTGAMAVGFFVWQIVVVILGKTPHEVRSAARVRSTSSVWENFRSVFGTMWLLNFIFPAHITFRQTGDGISWKYLKPA